MLRTNVFPFPSERKIINWDHSSHGNCLKDLDLHTKTLKRKRKEKTLIDHINCIHCDDSSHCHRNPTLIHFFMVVAANN